LKPAKISGYRCAIDVEEPTMNWWKAVMAVMFLAVLAPAPALASHAPKVKTICEPGTHLGSNGVNCVADGMMCEPGQHLNSKGTRCLADQPPKVCRPGYHLSHSGKHCLHDY
jgi:hypothetical protein